MKHLILATTVLGTASTGAFAGGIERRGDPSQILFEDGDRYLEFSVSSVQPDVSGVGRTGTPGATFAPTGDIQKTFQNYAVGYKNQISDRLTIAFVIDEPVGADVEYRTPVATSGGAFFGGSSAAVDSIQLSAMAKYNATDRFSVYGGLRYVGLSGDITVRSPATATATTSGGAPSTSSLYNLNVDKDWQLGYLLGAAYEIPDIAFRVALTYESKTEHDFRDSTGAPFEVELPQSVTLHAQSGIAPDTLLFGSVRWREWTEFEVAPEDFFFSENPGAAPFVNAPIAFNNSDIYTYRLGLGRSFTDRWSGAFVLGYEEQTGDQKGNLDGTDGFMSYTLALTHELEALEVTGALSYVDFGNADTNVVSFRGNDAVAFGLKVGYRF